MGEGYRWIAEPTLRSRTHAAVIGSCPLAAGLLTDCKNLCFEFYVDIVSSAGLMSFEEPPP
jgi:hypothetical protein